MIRWRLVARIALWNVLGQKRRALLLCSVLALVAATAVVGSVLVANIERGMRGVIQSSLAGELQVLPRTSVGRLALFDDAYFGDNKLDGIKDVKALTQRLRAIPQVTEVAPLSLRLAVIQQPSPIDAAVERLRAAHRVGDKDAQRAAEGHLRWAASRLSSQLARLKEADLPAGELERRRAVIARVLSDELWERISQGVDGELMFLDASFAPLFGDSTPVFSRTIGADIDALTRAFPRLEIVQGRALDPDEPGFLVAEWVMRVMRHRYTARFERLREVAPRLQGELPVERIEGLQQAASNLVDQLTPPEAQHLAKRLCERVECPDNVSPEDALKLYADVNKENVQERYRYLEDEVMKGLPPGLFVIGREYSMSMADAAGGARTTLLRLVGTFRFRGLDELQVQIHSITNARSFAQMDDEERVSTQVTEEDSAAPTIGDDLFFAEDAPAIRPVAQGDFDEFAGWTGPEARDPAAFSLADWPAKTLALRLSAPPDAVLRDEIAKAIADTGGAQDLITLDGFAVAGTIGQAVPILKAIFGIVLALLLLLAFGVIGNGLVLSWLRRIRELGTLRAVGATRADVGAALFLEALTLGVIGAISGTALGCLVLFALKQTGIPAPSAIFTFIFGGDRLHPVLVLGALPLGGSVIVLALLAAVYPAWRANRVSPREAMETMP